MKQSIHMDYSSHVFLDHPEEDAKIQGNALNTLFVSRLPYTATSDDLKNLFRQHGPIVRVRLTTVL